MLRRTMLVLAGLASLGVVPATAFAETCPNEQLRAENNSTALPDCRAYEQVSPPDKSGVNVGNQTEGGATTFQAAADGSGIAYDAAGAFGDAQAAPQFTYYRGLRTPGGWVDTAIDPPKAPTHGISGAPLTISVSADLSKSLVYSGVALAPGAVANQINLYIRDNDAGTYTFVATYDPPGGLFGQVPVGIAASPDLSRVIFQAPVPFTSDAAPAGAADIYEWANGVLRLVNVLPNGSVDVGGGWVTGPLGSNPYLGDGVPDEAVSDDFRRIYFNSPSPNAGSASIEQVYLREDGRQTTRISASQRSTPDPEGTQPAEFAGASADGLYAYFLSGEKLTNDSTAVAGNEGYIGGWDLYRYEVTTGELQDLTVSAEPGGAQVIKVLGTGGDGSYLYFVALGHLAAGATVGQPNVYVYHEGVTSFIATDPNGGFIKRATFAISANGRYLEYVTASQLTSSDTGGTLQVYRYDADSGSLTCASCPPSGVVPTTSAALHDATDDELSGYFQRTMLDDGRAFFQTAESLVPADINGQTDVYVYNGSEIALLSDGAGAWPSRLEDVDPSGANVYFITADQLVPSDQDQLVDLYDARVEGGFRVTSTASTSQCSGDECQGSPSAPLALPSVGSLSSSGSGNAIGTSGSSPREISRVTASGKQLAGSPTASVAVKVRSAGEITLAGPLVKSEHRAAGRSATYTLRVSLTASAKAQLARKRKLRVAVRIAFVPASGGASRTSVTLVFTKPATKTKGR